MKSKNIEFFLFSTLVVFIVLELLEFPFLFLLHINLLALIFLWIFGKGFSKSEFWERILSIPLIYGFILTSASANYNNFISTLGIVILVFLFFIKGIQKLSKRDVFTSIEFFLVCFLLLGFLFRIWNYPGASVLRLFSMLMLQIYYLAMGIRFAIYIYHQKEEMLSIFSFLLCCILCFYMNAILLDTMNWQGSMMFFWVAVISSLVVLPVVLFKLFGKNSFSEIISFHIGKIFKRFVLITGVSLFFAVASPHQYLRFVYGNRPKLIEAFYNCWILDTNTNPNKVYCDEFYLLERLLRAGIYYQGMSDEALEEAKNNFNEQ